MSNLKMKRSGRPKPTTTNYLQKVLERGNFKKIEFSVKKRQVPLFLDKCFYYLNNERDHLSGTIHKELINLTALIAAEAGLTSTIKYEKEDLAPLSGVEKSDFLSNYKLELNQLLCNDNYTDSKRRFALYHLVFVYLNIPAKFVEEWLDLCKKQAAEENQDISIDGNIVY